MARHVWQPRQWELPCGTAKGARGHESLPDGAPVAERAYEARGWTANTGRERSSPSLSGLAEVPRGKDYRVLDYPLVQARLHLPPDQVQQRPESQMGRDLYDCPEVPVGAEGIPCRVVVATHPEGSKKSPVGVTRAGVVYELFFSNLPPQAFTAADVVELYLHRGAFEPALSDEDAELDPDRWCSHSAWGRSAGRWSRNGFCWHFQRMA